MDFYLLVAICFLGWGFKILEKVVSLKDNPLNAELTLWSYLKENGLRTTLSIFGAAAAFVIFNSTGQLNEVAAFSSGYLGESAARALTQNIKPHK